jgi:hypothetical protein
MIRHMVALRFKAGTDEAIKRGLYDELAGLKDHIDGILDFQTYKNVSIELPLVRDLSDVFWFDFRDAAVRDAYLNDPVHQAIGGRIVAELEGGSDGVYVFDVEL